MRFTRTAAAAAIAVAAVLTASGCATSSSDKAASDDTGNIRVWFMQDSVSDEAQQWLEQSFAKEHPGSKLTVEVQQWDDIVSKLQTSLASTSETPDVVEIGNTKATTFANVGALADLSDDYQDLGGSDLIPSFVKAGTVDGKRYALPMYAGASVIYYRKDLFQAAGIAAPTTLPELVAAAKKVQAANPGMKGMYLPAADVHGLESWMFSYGGNYAKQTKDGSWKGSLTSSSAQDAFAQLQDLWSTASLGAFDASSTSGSPWVPYNNDEVAIFSSRSYAAKNISADLQSKTGVIALPAAEQGGTSHQFLGGSSVAVSAKSQHPELARDALKLILGKTFSKKLADDQGWIPGNATYATSSAGGLVSADLQAEIAKNSSLTPSAKNWAIVEGDNIPADFYAKLAKGQDPKALAKTTDTAIEQVLNAK